MNTCVWLAVSTKQKETEFVNRKSDSRLKHAGSVENLENTYISKFCWLTNWVMVYRLRDIFLLEIRGVNPPKTD